MWLNDRRWRTDEARHELASGKASDERFARSVELPWALVAAAVVGVAIWMSTWWLLAQTHGLHDVEEAQARMDAC